MVFGNVVIECINILVSKMGNLFVDPCVDPHAPTDIFGRPTRRRRPNTQYHRPHRRDEEIEKAKIGFQEAIKNGNESLAKFHINEYPEIDFLSIPFDEYGNNCLHYAVILQYSHLELCTAYIRSIVAIRDEKGSVEKQIEFPIPLIEVITDYTEPRLDIESRRIRTVSALLDLGASVKFNCSLSSIHFVGSPFKHDCIFQPIQANSVTGETAIQIAEKRKRLKVLNILR